MKNIPIYFILIVSLVFGCQQRVNQCKDISPDEKFTGSGYMFYFGFSQDSMGDFWFFPSCDSIDKIKDTFFEIEYKKGISFKLPLTGNRYKELSAKFHHVILEGKSFANNVWYVPVYIEIEKTKKSLVHLPDISKNWTISLKHNNQSLVLSYFVTDEITINQLEVK